MTVHHSVQTFPNGMLMPEYYGVWHSQWYVANRMRRTFMLYVYDSEAPGPEWSPSPQIDESGNPRYWFLDVPEDELDRLVRVEVTAKWKGNDLGLVRYRNGIVHARVGVDPRQRVKVDRGEIPEIYMLSFGEYVGTFRWEELEDIQMLEKDLKT